MNINKNDFKIVYQKKDDQIQFNLGKQVIDELFQDAYESGNGIFKRECPGCDNNYKIIYYKRLTPIPNGLSIYDLFNDWRNYPGNILNIDFKLYGGVDENVVFNSLINDQQSWQFCNYNDPGIGFPRDCGPNNSLVRGFQWNSERYRNSGQTTVTYSIFDGFETNKNNRVDSKPYTIAKKNQNALSNLVVDSGNNANSKCIEVIAKKEQGTSRFRLSGNWVSGRLIAEYERPFNDKIAYVFYEAPYTKIVLSDNPKTGKGWYYVGPTSNFNVNNLNRYNQAPNRYYNLEEVSEAYKGGFIKLGTFNFKRSINPTMTPPRNENYRDYVEDCPDGWQTTPNKECINLNYFGPCLAGRCRCPPGYRYGGNNICYAGWSYQCGQDCAYYRCVGNGGTWIPKDYRYNAYTCRMDRCWNREGPSSFKGYTPKAKQDWAKPNACNSEWPLKTRQVPGFWSCNYGSSLSDDQRNGSIKILGSVGNNNNVEKAGMIVLKNNVKPKYFAIHNGQVYIQSNGEANLFTDKGTYQENCVNNGGKVDVYMISDKFLNDLELCQKTNNEINRVNDNIEQFRNKGHNVNYVFLIILIIFFVILVSKFV